MNSESVSLFPRVADVLDRLDTKTVDEREDLARRLTEAVTETCSRQGLAPAPALIEAAVQEHLDNAPRAPAPGSAVRVTPEWGWKRPVTEEERQRRQRGNVWQRFLVGMGRCEDCMGITFLVSLLGGVVAGLLLGTLIHSTGWRILFDLMTMPTLAIALSLVTLGFPFAAADQHKALEKVIPDEKDTKRWLDVPEARRQVRQCLSSTLPYLMKGDITRISALVKAEDDRRAAQAEQEAAQAHQRQEEARMAALRQQFTDVDATP
jgi:hypothetical protein